MPEEIFSENEFDGLEKALKGFMEENQREIIVELSNISALVMDIGDSNPVTRKRILNLYLEEVARNDNRYGLRIAGQTETHYWVLGTHTPDGHVSRISDAAGNLIYENHGPYKYPKHTWQIVYISKEDYRGQIGWKKPENPPNPFIGIPQKIDPLTSLAELRAFVVSILNEGGVKAALFGPLYESEN